MSPHLTLEMVPQDENEDGEIVEPLVMVSLLRSGLSPPPNCLCTPEHGNVHSECCQHFDQWCARLCNE